MTSARPEKFVGEIAAQLLDPSAERDQVAKKVTKLVGGMLVQATEPTVIEGIGMTQLRNDLLAASNSGIVSIEDAKKRLEEAVTKDRSVDYADFRLSQEIRNSGSIQGETHRPLDDETVKVLTSID